jgi:hypothetical protein
MFSARLGARPFDQIIVAACGKSKSSCRSTNHANLVELAWLARFAFEGCRLIRHFTQGDNRMIVDLKSPTRRTTALVRGMVAVGVTLLLVGSCTNDHKNLTEPTKGLAHIPSFSTSSTTSSGASFTTDKDDYAPGETVNLAGTNWPANDSLDILLDETPQNHPPVNWAVGTDASGSFTDGTYVVQESDAGTIMTITATSRANASETATASFDPPPPPSGSLCAEVTGHGASVCTGLANDPAGVLGTGVTHYAQVVGTTADYQIRWESSETPDYLAESSTASFCPSGVLVQIQSTPLGNTVLCGTLTTTRIISFTWTAPSNGCSTSVVAYRSGTTGGGAPRYTGSDNDIVADDDEGNSPTAAAGIGYTSSSHPTTAIDCGGTANPPTISKDATGSYKNTFKWTITKDVTPKLVEQFGGGTATFNYTVTVTRDPGTISDVKVSGTITLNNPNSADITGATITDALSDATNCTVTGGTNATLTPGDKTFAYSCNLGAVPSGALSNTATVAWGAQTVGVNSLAAGSADKTVGPISFTETIIDGTVTVTDPNSPNPPLPATVSATTTFTYSTTIAVPATDCKKYDNTATFTTNTTGTTGSASQTVEVCGPAKTGALTMGFWQNKNGQAIITGGSSTSGVCNSGTWLRQYAPFQDLSATATCTQVASYVTNIIKAANASGAAMNAMLKGQMLATALDVYFSDPLLGSNKIGAPAPVGGVSIDLTKICATIYNPTPSTSTCQGGITEDASPEFGGSPKTVLQMLSYASGQSNIGGSTWYGQVKLTQEFAKDAFDAINNQLAFAP